jgi:hypothetical protein
VVLNIFAGKVREGSRSDGIVERGHLLSEVAMERLRRERERETVERERERDRT